MWSSRNIEDHIEPDQVDERVEKIRRTFQSVRKKTKQVAKSRGLSKSAANNYPKTRKAGLPVSSMDMVSTTAAFKPQDVSRKLPKSRLSSKLKKNLSRVFIVISKQKKRAFVVVFSVLTLVAAANLIFSKPSAQRPERGDETDALGVSVSSEKVENSQTGPDIVTTTEFELLFSSGKSQESFEIALVSPPQNEPVYAYVDTIDGIELRISQQRVPEAFAGDQATKLEEVAKDFQATDIIQIDDMKVYHGFTERFGGTQSLVFIKKDVMVFISSAQKQSDDVWAGYVLGLE
jgi:hypothetical protein